MLIQSMNTCIAAHRRCKKILYSPRKNDVSNLSKAQASVSIRQDYSYRIKHKTNLFGQGGVQNSLRFRSIHFVFNKWLRKPLSSFINPIFSGPISVNRQYVFLNRTFLIFELNINSYFLSALSYILHIERIEHGQQS